MLHKSNLMVLDPIIFGCESTEMMFMKIPRSQFEAGIANVIVEVIPK